MTCYVCGRTVRVSKDGRRALAHSGPRPDQVGDRYAGHRFGSDLWTGGDGKVRIAYKDGRTCAGAGRLTVEARHG